MINFILGFVVGVIVTLIVEGVFIWKVIGEK